SMHTCEQYTSRSQVVRYSAPHQRQVTVSMSTPPRGGGSLLPVFVGVGVQVVLDGGLTVEEKLHSIQGKPFPVIPSGPAAIRKTGDVPINVTFPNDDLRLF